MRPVFFSDSRTIASSIGLTVRRSMTSASMPSDCEQRRGLQCQLDRVRRADDRDVAAATPVDALADRHAVGAFGHDAVLLHQPPMLEDAHRVVVEDRRQQKALRVVRRARHHDLQARHAEQHALDRLRMLRARSPAAADRRPHHHRHGRLAVVHEVELRGVRHELVEREQHEVRAVVHEHRAHAVHGGARGHPHHRLLPRAACRTRDRRRSAPPDPRVVPNIAVGSSTPWPRTNTLGSCSSAIASASLTARHVRHDAPSLGSGRS